MAVVLDVVVVAVGVVVVVFVSLPTGCLRTLAVSPTNQAACHALAPVCFYNSLVCCLTILFSLSTAPLAGCVCVCFTALSDNEYGGGVRSVRSGEESGTARHEQAQGLAGGGLGTQVSRGSCVFFSFVFLLSSVF